MQPDLLRKTADGIFCEEGNFYVDPWGAIPIALITHAHSDHAYRGSRLYYCTEESAPILKHRLGNEAALCTKAYGEKFKMGSTWVSFHPAGHILGSAQIRIERKNRVTIFSGDYKRAFDSSCTPFEIVACDELITESTFALPIYQWKQPQEIAMQIVQWWRENAERGQSSILFCYALGKAQRILSHLKPLMDQPVIVHGSIAAVNELYALQNIPLADWIPAKEMEKSHFNGCLALAPPSAVGTAWIKRFQPCKTALASGWMAVRGTRRYKGLDTGFVLSDHADWPALLQTIRESQAKKIWVTHGREETLARYLREKEQVEAAPFHITEYHVQEDED